jgi:ABC-type cobalamin/Fe3+-siderophores transport system ATPase subunit
MDRRGEQARGARVTAFSDFAEAALTVLREAARVSLAALLLARFDVLCLDEPTNDLDFEGLEQLELFVQRYDGSIVLVLGAIRTVAL